MNDAIGCNYVSSHQGVCLVLKSQLKVIVQRNEKEVLVRKLLLLIANLEDSNHNIILRHTNSWVCYPLSICHLGSQHLLNIPTWPWGVVWSPSSTSMVFLMKGFLQSCWSNNSKISTHEQWLNGDIFPSYDCVLLVGESAGGGVFLQLLPFILLVWKMLLE